MRYRQGAIRILAIVLLIASCAIPVPRFSVPVGGAWAADCTPPPVADGDSASAALSDLRADGCLGGEACSAPLCAKVGAFVEKWCGKGQGEFCRPQPISADFFNQAQDLIGELRDRGEALPADGTAVSQLRGMLARWDGTFAAIGHAPVSGARLTEWDTGGMRLFPDTVYALDLEEAFAASCGKPDLCQKSFDSARESYTEAALTHRVLAVLAGAEVQDVFKRLATLDARWHAYHNGTRAIYPWELLANGYLVHESQVKGFAEPPDRQILLLHPSAGMEYRFSGGDRLQEAIQLDVAGLYWWHWGGELDAELKFPLGLALAVSYDGVEPSYGVTAHFPKNWSLGVGVDRHSKVSLQLSLDFGNFLMDKTSSVDKLREKFESD
jgi:hypothetical protein